VEFSQFDTKRAFQKLGVENLTPWSLDVPPRAPTAVLLEMLRRLELSFDLKTSEAAKELLIDALCADVLPDHPRLKAWKAVPLRSEDLVGMADYLIAPNRAYLDTPLLCVVEAKRDDFVQGEAQCLVEMYACMQNNRQSEWEADIFGIVSNGQGWQFYRLAAAGGVSGSSLYSVTDLPQLLGILDYIFGECESEVP